METKIRWPQALLVLALLVAVGIVPAAAAATGGPHDISRLGGSHAFCKPPLKGPEDLKKFFATKRADIDMLLAATAWDGKAEDLYKAVENGQFRATEMEVGTTLRWMALRRAKKVEFIANPRWKGVKSVPVFEISFDSNGSHHVFLVPYVCVNLALLDESPLPPPPVAPTAKLSVAPSSDCVTRPITVDASGSSATNSKLTGVKVAVKSPDGKTSDLAPAGGNKWTVNYRDPGTYTFTAVATADNGLSSTPATATAEVKPCPPVAAISASPIEVLTHEMFNVETCASHAVVGNLKVVEVEVIDASGKVVDKFETSSPCKKDMKLDKAGTYTLRAVAVDDLGQRSAPAETTITVLSRTGFLADALVGKERREREEFDGGRCAALFGFNGGLSYLLDRQTYIAGLGGVAVNLRDSDNSSLFADVEIDRIIGKSFIGGGVGVWDFTHSDTVTGDLILHGGVNLTEGSWPIDWIIEGRLPFDGMDSIENNYIVWTGVRIHHKMKH